MNLARVSTSREVPTSPSGREPTAGASSTPEANYLEVGDVHQHCPSIVVGERDIVINVNPALPAGIKTLLQDLTGEFSSVFEGGTIEPRCYSQADHLTFCNSSQVEQVSAPARGTLAARGNKRLDTHAPSLAVAVAILAGVTAPVQAGSYGPESLPPLHTERMGGSLRRILNTSD
jgi:hypothetical protein